MRTVSPVRGLLPGILSACLSTQANARDLIARAATEAALSRRDAALLTKVALGTVRARATLERVLSSFAGVPLRRVQPRLLPVLLPALFELLFLDRVPARAVLFEAVELAKKRGGRRAGGFVNAVLRKVQAGARRSDCPAGPASRVLPLPHGRAWTFDRDVFTPPEASLADHLAQVHSHPAWLVSRWLGRFGPAATERVLRADNAAPVQSLRENPARPPEGGLRAYLENHGLAAETGPVPGTVRVPDLPAALDLPAFEEGRYTVQDPTAAAAALLADVRPGDRVLDMCAAPGGKTGVLAARADDGLVVGADRSALRLATQAEAMARLRLPVFLVCADGRRPPFASAAFDLVLLDAPCSNTGVLGRRVEARWRLAPDAPQGLARLQLSLLSSAARLARRSLLYSTCSIEIEENQEVVRRFVEGHRGWTVTAERFALPGPADGGYAATLSRTAG